jgi:hypothetical protein
VCAADQIRKQRGKIPESYGVEFEKILNKKYLRNNGFRLMCAVYTAYQGKTLKSIFKQFDIHQRKRNDRLIVSKMKKLIRRKRRNVTKQVIIIEPKQYFV